MSNSTFNDPWYLQRKFKSLIKLSAVSLLAAPAALMAVDGVQVAGDMCQVYMLHDGKLNDSQMLVVDIPVAQPDVPAPIVLQPFEAKLYGSLLPGFDLEAMDMRTNEDGESRGLYVASGDDTASPGTIYLVLGGNPAKIGQVCDVKAPDGSVIEGCVAEIDGISFAPNDNCMLGWGQDFGLFKVCLNDQGNEFEDGSAELLIPAHGEFEDITWNMDGTVLYAVENDWNFTEEQFFDLTSIQTSYTDPGTNDHPYLHVNESYYQPDPSMQGDDKAPTKLWRYDPADDVNPIMEVCAAEIAQLKASCGQVEIEALDAIPSPTEAGEPLPGDTLAIGYHRCSKDIVNLIRLTVQPNGDCNVEQSDEVQIDFSALKEANQNTPADIEGIAWPCSPWTHTTPDPCLNLVYAKDSADDSTAVPEPDELEAVSSPIMVGDTEYEIYGLGFEQNKGNDSDRLTIAVNSNMTLAGQMSNNENVHPNVDGSAAAGERNVALGDFIIEITKLNDDHEEVTELYGIHFVPNNDSPLPGDNTGVGLYKIDDSQFVSGHNYPWTMFYSYNEYVVSKGGTPSLAHIGEYDLGMWNSAPISIDPNGAVKIADVEILANKTAVGANSNLEFTPETFDSKQGLNFGEEYNDGEDHTFGVSFEMPEEWAHATKIRISLFVECANDGVVLDGPFCPDPDEENGVP